MDIPLLSVNVNVLAGDITVHKLTARWVGDSRMVGPDAMLPVAGYSPGSAWAPCRPSCAQEAPATHILVKQRAREAAFSDRRLQVRCISAPRNVQKLPRMAHGEP